MKKFILSKKFLLIILSLLLAFSISFSVVDLTNTKDVNSANSYEETNTSTNQNSSFGASSFNVSDLEVLKANKYTSCYANQASNVNDARALLDEYISSLGVTTDYDIVNEKLVSAQVGSNGKYTADVLLNGEEDFVTISVTISQYAEPAVLDFSSATDIKACATSGTSLTSENGKLRMTKTTTSDWDGFFLQFSTGALTDKPFMAEDYRYLKVKFKLESNYPAMMFWVFPKNGQNMYKDFHLGSEVSKNNEITLIIDLKVRDWLDTSIWCYNDTNNTVKTYKFLENSSDPRYVLPYEGEISSFRFNFGTWAGQRTALVDYLGFFSTFDEARAYEPIASDFSQAAQDLVSNELTTIWGNAESKAEAEQTAIELIGEKYGLSCSIINSTYVVPTTESKGKLTFDAAFEVGSKSEIVKGIKLVIDEKPSYYILLDLKDPEFVDGGGVEFANATHYWDGEYLKMDGTDGVMEDGFYFHVYFEKMQNQFYLQDYPFIVFRYKRIGIAGGQLFFWTEGWAGDIPYFDLFFGRHEGDWYTSILCTDSRSYDEPVVINYNETRGEIEPVPYHVGYGYSKTQFEGLVETIRFNYSRKKYIDREAWLDYIGFFSTFEEAESYYIQKSLNKYEGGTLEYFEADTRENAIETVNKLFDVKVGLGDYKINLTNVNYTAPVKNSTNGSLSARVKIISSDGVTIFNKTVAYDIDCMVDAEKTEMFFSNPYFTRELTGSMVSCVDYQKAKLTGYNPNFTWSVNVNKQFFLREKPYAVFKVNADADTFVFTANDTKYTLDYAISGENIIVLDLLTGDFIIDGNVVATCDIEKLPSGKITEIGIKFKSATSTTSSTAEVYSIAFCSTIAEATSYTCIQDKTKVNEFATYLNNLTINAVEYSKANTEMKALKEARKVVEKALKSFNNAAVFDVYSLDYVESTLSAQGYLKFVATIHTTEDKYAAQFKDVSLVLPIGLRPVETGKKLEVNEGYDFDGNNYLQQYRDLEKMPSTIEVVLEVHPTSINKVVLSNKTLGTTNYFAIEINASGKAIFVYNGQIVLTSTTAINNGNKTQIAVTINQGVVTLYVDGVKNAENTSFEVSNTISLRAPLVGADYTVIGEGFNTENYFIGKIYHLSYFDKVVDNAELSNNAFTTDLSGYWEFKDVDEDDRVKNHKGVRDAYFHLYNKEDKYSHEGHEFLGYDEKIALSQSLATASTFEWWMKVDESCAQGKYNIIVNEDKSLDISIENGKLSFKYGALSFKSNNIITDGAWKHYAIVVSDNVKLYVDGDLSEQFNLNGETLTTIGILTIGGSEEKDILGITTVNDFVGSLSDIRIWNTVKNESEIKNNRFVYPSGSESGLITSIRLDSQKYLVYSDYSITNNNGTLSATGWYKLENITTDYTIAHFADTQSYMFKESGAEQLNKMYAHVKEKKDEYNIVFAEHLGDACQDATNLQWEIISDSHLNIEGLVPYIIALGNHDYSSPYTGIGATFRDTTLFDEQFTLERMTAQFDNIDHARFGGTYDGKSAENMYMFFDAGEPTVNYIAFAIEFGPRDSVLQWVEDVLVQYPNHKAIISTHCYYNMYGDKSTYNSTTNDAFRDGNEGVEIWEKLVSKNDNIVMVMCGHSQNQLWQGHVDKNDFGNDVLQILADPSAMVTGFPSEEGLMMYMCFSNDGTMHTYYYSPLYDAYYDSSFENTYEMRVV